MKNVWKKFCTWKKISEMKMQCKTFGENFMRGGKISEMKYKKFEKNFIPEK